MKTNPFFFALALLFQLLWTTAAYADTAASTTKHQCAQQTGHWQSIRSGKSWSLPQILHTVKTLTKQAKHDKAMGRGGDHEVHYLATLGFVMSMLGLTFLFIGSIAINAVVISFICSIFAIIFCAIAMNRIKHGQGKYRGFGLALAGLIIGILLPFLVLSVAFLYFFVG